MDGLKLSEYPRLARWLRDVGYRKHSICIRRMPSIVLSGGYWDSGSVTKWQRFGLNGSTAQLNYPTTPPQFGGGRAPEHTIPEGQMVLRTGRFRGKAAMGTIYGSEETLAKLLERGK